MEVNKEAMHNPIIQDTKNGKLRYYKYNPEVGSLVNYGAISQTWEHPDEKHNNKKKNNNNNTNNKKKKKIDNNDNNDNDKKKKKKDEKHPDTGVGGDNDPIDGY